MARGPGFRALPFYASAAALVLSIQLLCLALSGEPPVTALELAAMDRLRGAAPPAPWPPELTLVAIDEEAVRVTGRWPWPRDRQATLLRRLKELGAKTLVYDAFLSGATDPAADRSLEQALSALPTVIMAEVSRAPAELPPQASARLARVTLPFPADPTVPPGAVVPPDEAFAGAAAAVGQAFALTEGDEKVRKAPPLLGLGGRALPSLALLGLLLQRGQDPARVRASPEALVFPDGRRRRLFSGQQILEPLRATDLPPVVVASRVLAGPDQPLKPLLAGKLVLVYADLLGTDRVATVAGPQVPGGWVNAYAIRSLAIERDWGLIGLGPVQLCLLLLSLICLPLVARADATSVVGTTALIAFAYLLFAAGMARFAFQVLPVLPPIATVLLTGVGLAGLRHAGVKRRAERAEARADAARAPRGRLALVFTDLEGSTGLWEKRPAEMRTALDLHNGLLRRLLARHGGYEVKTEGDSFMVAFPEVTRAVRFCLETQAEMPGLPWPAALTPEGGALRVRMGIHTGEPEPSVDGLTGRMDYLGPVVNKAARVAAAARGGQVLASEAAWEEIRGSGTGGLALVHRELGPVPLKGFDRPEALVELLPAPASPAGRPG